MTKFIISFEDTAAIESELDEVLFLKMAEDKAKTDELGDAILHAGEVSQTIQSIQEETDPEKKTEIALEYLYRSIGMQSDFSLESFNADRFNKAYRYASEGFIGKLIENHKYEKSRGQSHLDKLHRIEEMIHPGIEGNKEIDAPGWQHFISPIVSSTHIDASELISKFKKFDENFYPSGSICSVVDNLNSKIKTIKKFIESNLDEKADTNKKLKELEESVNNLVDKSNKVTDNFYKLYKEHDADIVFKSANAKQCEEICKFINDSLESDSKLKIFDLRDEYFTAIEDISYLLNSRWSDKRHDLYNRYVRMVNNLTIKAMYPADGAVKPRARVLHGMLRFIETSIKLK